MHSKMYSRWRKIKVNVALSVSEVLVTSLISTVILQEARFIIFFFPGKEKKKDSQVLYKE